MKLIQLKQDKREIKSVCYIDEKNNIITAYDRFGEIKEQYKQSILVYQPNKEQQAFIYDLLANSARVEEDKFKSELSVDDTYTLLKELTDIELGDEETDKEAIKDMLENPSLLLLEINVELDSICNHLFRKLYNKMLELDKYPAEIKEALYTSKEQQQLELDNAIAERELQELREQKEKELKALEDELQAKRKKKTTKKK